MIIRPDGLIEVDYEIEFNGFVYQKLEIDLAHVNKDDRSSYSTSDVVKIVETLHRL